MITNFEELTEELTEQELNRIVPALIRGLRTKIGKENTITNKQMKEGLEEICNIKTTEPRIRKMIQYIRISGSIERLIATSKGYYISNDVQELKDYLESLMQRADSIMLTAKQIQFQLDKFK